MKDNFEEDSMTMWDLFHDDNALSEVIPLNVIVSYDPSQNQSGHHSEVLPTESYTRSIMSYQLTPALNSQIVLPSPLMVLNLSGHSGLKSFGISVPKVCGKNKWVFSSTMDKLYAGKDIFFPVEIRFPANRNLSVVVCPVFESTGLRFAPVRKCYNCSVSDHSPFNGHFLRVDGSHCCYLMHNERTLVEVPLHNHPLDATSMRLLLQMTCRTSCSGGPNRSLFALMFTLLDECRNQIAQDVLHVKCCESPLRDLKKELKTHKVNPVPTPNTKKIAKISSSIETNNNKKRKFELKIKDNEPEYVRVKIPKIYEKSVKKYVNLLHWSQLCHKNSETQKYFSTTDTE